MEKVSTKEADGRREMQADTTAKIIIQIMELKQRSIILVSEIIY
ncbi:hypothetical protein [uncultured Granulicatella sp.]|nr:hypothetical protein [uncultured Granulicatella sp.]